MRRPPPLANGVFTLISRHLASFSTVTFMYQAKRHRLAIALGAFL